jgi:hypothetical protein
MSVIDNIEYSLYVRFGMEGRVERGVANGSRKLTVGKDIYGRKGKAGR